MRVDWQLAPTVDFISLRVTAGGRWVGWRGTWNLKESDGKLGVEGEVHFGLDSSDSIDSFEVHEIVDSWDNLVVGSQ